MKVPFSQVCLSTSHAPRDRSHGRGYPHTYPPLWTYPLPPRLYILPEHTHPCCWYLVVITGNLLKRVHLKTYPFPVLTSSGSHRSGRYASYWNAFLLWLFLTIGFYRTRHRCQPRYRYTLASHLLSTSNVLDGHWLLTQVPTLSRSAIQTTSFHCERPLKGAEE